MNPKVFAHTSYIGTGGYNNHSRDFFRHLSKLIKLKIRNFTIGQRKGIGIESKGKPIFVTKIYPSKNIVEVGPSNELMQRKAYISKVNIISKQDKITNKEIFAKILYKSTPAKGRLTLKNDGNAVFIFDEPQRAITPGQALVFYYDNEVIGGGFIEYEDSTLLKEKNKETVKSY